MIHCIRYKEKQTKRGKADAVSEKKRNHILNATVAITVLLGCDDKLDLSDMYEKLRYVEMDILLNYR